MVFVLNPDGRDAFIFELRTSRMVLSSLDHRTGYLDLQANGLQRLTTLQLSGMGLGGELGCHYSILSDISLRTKDAGIPSTFLGKSLLSRSGPCTIASMVFAFVVLRFTF